MKNQRIKMYSSIQGSIKLTHTPPMQFSRPALLAFSFICLLLNFMGCTSFSSFVQPTEQQLEPFLEQTHLLVHDDRSPFGLVWIDKAKLSYHKGLSHTVFVTPPSVVYLNKEPTLPSLPQEDQISLSEFTHKTFIEALTETVSLPVTTVNTTPSPTMNLELALMEVIPTNALLEGATDIAGLFLPGAVLLTTAESTAGAVASHELGKGYVTIAGKMKTTNGDLIVEFYEKREDRSAILISTHDFSKYGNARSNIAEIAKEYAELLSTEDPAQVTTPSSFALVLW